MPGGASAAPRRGPGRPARASPPGAGQVVAEGRARAEHAGEPPRRRRVARRSAWRSSSASVAEASSSRASARSARSGSALPARFASRPRRPGLPTPSQSPRRGVDVGEPEPREPPGRHSPTVAAHDADAAPAGSSPHDLGEPHGQRPQSARSSAPRRSDRRSAALRCSLRLPRRPSADASIQLSNTSGDASGWNCTPHAVLARTAPPERCRRVTSPARRHRRAAARRRRGSTGCASAPGRDDLRAARRPDPRRSRLTGVRPTAWPCGLTIDLAPERGGGELMAQADPEEAVRPARPLWRSATWSGSARHARRRRSRPSRRRARPGRRTRRGRRDGSPRCPSTTSYVEPGLRRTTHRTRPAGSRPRAG